VQGIDMEVLLASAYAVFLILVAFALEKVARHSHHRAERARLAGFKYHADHDLWECPSGERLMRVAFDHERRLSLYRAPANVCNGCSLKQLCTASDKGREIEQSPDSWLQSELSRFHRGISLSLLLLAEILLTIEMMRHRGATELLVMGSLLLTTTFVSAPLFSAFFASRARARRNI
jgi:hypothetical protein